MQKENHIPLLCLPDQSDIGFAHTAPLRFARMLRAIKDEHLTRDGLRCDQIRVLRHVARAVDLSIVVNFLSDLDARLWRDGVTT